ncbi:unknown [Firmicutes bacterium CAG:94]|nr:unknown [Firmicutes bacterium CAG:94]
MGNAAPADFLLLPHIPAVLVVKGRAVHDKAGGGAEHLGVARPAHALVPLGAVGGHVHKVVLLAPLGVENQAVHLFAASLQEADFLQVGVEAVAQKGALIGLAAGPARHLDVPVAVEGEIGAHHGRPSIGNVAVLAQGGAHVVPVEAAVLQQLAELQAQLRALGQVGAQRKAAGDDLAHVQHPLVLFGVEQRGVELLLPPDGQAQAGGGLRQRQAGGDLLHRQPAGPIPFGGSPVGDFLGLLVALAVVNAAEGHRGGRALPGVIRPQHHFPAVRQQNADLQPEEELLGEGLRREALFPCLIAGGNAPKAKPALGPAVAQHGPQGVLALVEQPGDVVRLVLQPPVIGGAARGQVLVPGLFPVGVQLVEPQAHGVNPGADRLPLQEEAAAQQGMDAAFQGRGDPLAGPFLPHFGGFKPGGGAGGLLAVVPLHRHPPPIPGAGLQVQGDGAVYRGQAGVLAGVPQQPLEAFVRGHFHPRPLLLFRVRFLHGPGKRQAVHLKPQGVCQPVDL